MSNNTEPDKLSTKTLKVPPVLEEFLFLNPDSALAFNDLPPSHKNEWILAIRAVKNQTVLEKLLKQLKDKLEKSE
jgi:Bacteriocin-protection, YdeI or OmpD-Associated